MPQKVSKRKKSQEKRSKNSSSTHKGEPPPDPPAKPGRKTNNSLASATGQILIDDNEVPVNSTRKKLKTSQMLVICFFFLDLRIRFLSLEQSPFFFVYFFIL